MQQKKHNVFNNQFLNFNNNLIFFPTSQFNIPLHRDSHSAYMENLWEEHSLFPMFWIEEYGDLDDTYKETLDDMLIKPLKIIDGVQWTLVSLIFILTNLRLTDEVIIYQF